MKLKQTIFRLQSVLTTICNELRKATLRSSAVSAATTLGLQPSVKCYELRNGVKVRFEPGTLDLMVIRECFINSLYAKFIKDHQLNTMLDLGCHKGYFYLGMLSQGFRITKAVCVDPLVENLELFRENLAQNPMWIKDRCEELILENSAISATDGTGTFYVTKNSVNHSLRDPSKYDVVVREQDVKLMSLKTLFAKHKIEQLDLVKMDIEGAEFELFASPDISEVLRARYIVMEIHPDERHPSSVITEVLENHGFNIQYPNPGYPDLIFASKRP